jgi:3-methyladenine DNA glycosylase AlkD
MLTKIKSDLQSLKNPEKAKILSRFFKTGKGQYGEGDVFLGINVPDQRRIAKKHPDLSLKDLRKLLSSKIHEYRLTSLFILTIKYYKADITFKKELFKFYINNIKNINNWDLVDGSAPYILGDYLLENDRSLLYKMAKSDNVWKRRIAIMTTFRFIKNNEFEDALNISEMLLKDKHDLIHKAVGWMLREIGKKDHKIEEQFLRKHYKAMPRTMLRYAIERFDVNKRRSYLRK